MAPKPLVVIVGPTASGKSKIAMKLAKEFNGEIIAADSRTVYRGMDIGTAKPTPEEQSQIKHHLLNLINPDKYFTAVEFKRLANESIKDITSRNKLPIMVGGTGLYIDGVIFDFAFLPPANPDERTLLEALNVEQLHKIIMDKGLDMPANSKNPRHLIRAIETNGAVPVKKDLRKNTLIIGIDVTKDEVVGNIDKRTAKMIEDGLEKEVRSLLETYSWQDPGMTAVGYREWKGFFEGKRDLSETKNKINKNSIQYAKRQRTWFKRNSSINWVKSYEDTLKLTKLFLHQS